MLRLFFLGLAVLLLSSTTHAQSGTAEATTDADFASREVEIAFNDGFTSLAEITSPAEGAGPWPTVILVHGGGPFDRNVTSYNPDGSVASTNFQTIAETLSAQGYTVLRYNKRGVLPDGTLDVEQFNTVTVEVLMRDLETVLAFAAEQPEVDTAQLYLYAWSEGTWVASNTAVGNPDAFAGLILQAPPNDELAVVQRYLYLDVVLPYLSDVIDADGDGQLTPEELEAVESPQATILLSLYVYPTPQATAEAAATEDAAASAQVFNPDTDTNGDIQIDIERELRPLTEYLVENYTDFVPQAEGVNYRNAELIAQLDVPVLVLHGQIDGWIPVYMAEEIAAAAPDRVTLNIYPNLGHALSPIEAPALDTLGVTNEAPLTDLVAWLNEQTQ